MSKRCPKCSEENREQARYCINCNYDLVLKDPPVKLCPAGRHTLDPSWLSCPYCSVPGTSKVPRPNDRIDPSEPAQPKPITTYSPSIVPLRRIIGILISYTWKAEGQVFPIREGRNYIGRDNDCEISLPEDSQMSSKHATIICRDGKSFMIDDEKSMNGTFVNDSSVEEKQRLSNYSKIKTGSTICTFIIINPEAK